MKPFNSMEKMSSVLFKNVINKIGLEIIYLINMYKKDLTLNDLPCLICHKTQHNQTKQKLI